MLGDGGTGVATYARNLAQAVEQISNDSMVLVARAQRHAHLPPWLTAMAVGSSKLARITLESGAIHLTGNDIFRRAHIHFGYRQQLYRLRCANPAVGIMHWTYPVPIEIENWINIYTVHDVIPLETPELTPIDPNRHRAVLKAIFARADRVLTVSESARQSILAATGIDNALVVNAGQAGGMAMWPTTQPPNGLTPGHYLLIVGSIEPRKNIPTMLAAYLASGVTMPLVIAGPDGWRADEITSLIAATPGAIRLPYLPRDALLALIKGARALALVSLAEGFGLPIIEAMTLGTPVLTSSSGALSEVAGDAALKVEPRDQAAIGKALARIAADDDLVAQLVAAGHLRVAEFSVAHFADRLRAIYREAATRHFGSARLGFADLSQPGNKS